MRPPGLGAPQKPFSGTRVPHWLLQVPLSLRDLDLTSHHQRGPPPGTPALEWAAIPGSSRLLLCLVTGFLHCIVSHGDK